jgi:hypothetical protein
MRVAGAKWGSVAALATLPFALAAQQPGAVPAWPTARPSSFVLTGLLTARGLAEASGVAPSTANPGVFWTIGDSGNPTELLAIDTTGTLRARIALTNTANVDWEAVSVGPCPGGTCVYIGDIGDNAERRAEVTIYRVVEPTVRGSARVTTGGVEALRVRYPDQAHDVEAMAVRADGTLMLVTKGRSGGVLLYEIGAEAWGSRNAATATRVDSLPITANAGMGRLVTDMALNAAGTRLAVRTYRDVFIFDRASSGILTPLLACDILGREPQGEGIAWLPSGRLLLVSERGFFQRGSINTMTCK